MEGQKVRRKKRKASQNFFDIWSQDMSYVLGFMFADGYLQKNKKTRSSYICFVSTDREVLTKIRRLIGSDHKIGVRKGGARDEDWKDLYVLQIGSQQLFQQIQKYGITQKKSLVIRFPEVPEKFLGDFVRGYFDGDGCVHIGKYWRKDRRQWKWQFTTRFTSGSLLFLKELLGRTKKYAEGGHIARKQRGYELVFAQKDSLALFGLMYHNVSADRFLMRKYKIFQKAFRILNLRA